MSVSRCYIIAIPLGSKKGVYPLFVVTMVIYDLIYMADLAELLILCTLKKRASHPLPLPLLKFV